MLACGNGSATLVDLLVQNGANTQLQDDKGQKAEDFAIMTNHSGLIDHLTGYEFNHLTRPITLTCLMSLFPKPETRTIAAWRRRPRRRHPRRPARPLRPAVLARALARPRRRTRTRTRAGRSATRMPARGTKASASTRTRCAASLYMYSYSVEKTLLYMQRIVSLNVRAFLAISEFFLNFYIYILMFSLF